MINNITVNIINIINKKISLTSHINNIININLLIIVICCLIIMYFYCTINKYLKVSPEHLGP